MSVEFVDPRAERLAAQKKKATSPETIAQLTEQLSVIQALIQAEEEGLKHFESPEWKWLTEQYLPARNLEIATNAMDIPPDDAIKKAIATGQRNENFHLTEELISARRRIMTHRQSAKQVQAAIDKYHEARKK